MAINECGLGIENKQRIIALERDMGKLSKMVTTLVISSFGTLVSVITTLIFLVMNK